MFSTELIEAKRDGREVPADEIRRFIFGITAGEVPDYQASALLMAAYINGLSDRETIALTQAMRDSGTVLSWPPSAGFLADKHSTGGVGDKISLILAPLAASMEIKVPMISGRSLGHTGGTLDKLESIPGLRVDLSLEEFQDQVNDIGVAMIGQTGQLAPADSKLYALRDSTGTIPSIPLICASILSKKLAEGVDHIVFDVKTGSGAFMKSYESAELLAKKLIKVSCELGCSASALITRMSIPIGIMTGNLLEVKESLEILDGGGPADTIELVVQLTSRMFLASGKGNLNRNEVMEMCRRNLKNGKARKVFEDMISRQGGDLDAFSRLPTAPVRLSVRSPRSGYLTGVDAGALGESIRELGGGRYRMEDRIDPAVGWESASISGVKVKTGEVIGWIHASKKSDAQKAAKHIINTLIWDREPEPIIIGEL